MTERLARNPATGLVAAYSGQGDAAAWVLARAMARVELIRWVQAHLEASGLSRDELLRAAAAAAQQLRGEVGPLA